MLDVNAVVIMGEDGKIGVDFTPELTSPKAPESKAVVINGKETAYCLNGEVHPGSLDEAMKVYGFNKEEIAAVKAKVKAFKIASTKAKKAVAEQPAEHPVEQPAVAPQA